MANERNMITSPRSPNLARELIARAKQSDEHWARLARLPPGDEQVGADRHIDHTNAEVLARAIADHGWPDVPLVGEGGAKAAWKLALRADTRADLQRLAYRVMYAAVKRGTASKRHWAHLYDRCLLGAGRPQFYGTQYRLGSSGPELEPVSEPDTDLDARRAALGLPLASMALHQLRDRLAVAPHFDDREYVDSPGPPLRDVA
ncbi:DUF6624 domain-containing protein [Streptomyces sp. NPDC058486]|uniref:DUF6624 domain-containing protein n=1 Tax=unclassified Streptomyces TaxID=2593676 RepID=UPI003654489A